MKALQLTTDVELPNNNHIQYNLKLLVNLKHLTSKPNKLLFINKLNNVDSSK